MLNFTQRGRAALLSGVTVAALAFAALAATSDNASGQSLTFDFGAHVEGAESDALLLGFELQGPSRFNTGAFTGSFATAGRVNELGDAWLGIGFAVQANLGPAWYLEGSIMPGLYHDNETDLGHAIEIRSLFGVGYRFAGGSSVMLSVDHLSNADIGDYNPGTNAVMLRYRRPL
ncbi:acyloxyacyl hydrolase [Cereibacter sphaeroides]|nr:acyloxyacyl hydrolase [Cereibacter sphaeroides]